MLFLLMHKNLQTFQLMLNLNSVLCHCWEGPCINHPHVLTLMHLLYVLEKKKHTLQHKHDHPTLL